KPAFFINRDRSDGSLFVSAMMLCSVLILTASKISLPLRFANQLFWLAERYAIFFCKFFRAICNEHHVSAMFIDGSCCANRILNALQTRRGAGAKRRAIHHDGVAFDLAFGVQVRTKSSVEYGSVLKNYDRRFNCIYCVAAACQNFPAFAERLETACLAS